MSTKNINPLKRIKISDGVFFSTVTDKRYKIGRIAINFLTKLSDETAAVNAIIPRLLSRQNKNFPDAKDFHNYEASLYSAKVNFGVDNIGDTQRLEISIISIDDAYALEGEKITKEAAKLIMDCLFSPALENGAFIKDDVETCKREQKEDIESELNDKRIYALNKAYDILCEGEPVAISKMGTVEQTAQITPESIYLAYKKMLEHFQIEIICVGCSDFSDVKNLTEEIFKSQKRSNVEQCSSINSYLKAEVCEKVEKLQVSQSKMVLGLKSDSKDYFAIALMAKIYGGTTTSKLFLNVREKLSLCYYCWARYDREKGIMHIDCGVESANIEKARIEILKQFEDVKNNDFSDSDFEAAMLSIENDAKTVSDSTGALSEWYLARIYRQDIKSPEESLSDYKKVTRQDIVKAANSMKLDTVYVLTGLEENV